MATFAMCKDTSDHTIFVPLAEPSRRFLFEELFLV